LSSDYKELFLLHTTTGVNVEEKEIMEQYFMKVVNILLPFSQADLSVQKKLCSPEVLQRIHIPSKNLLEIK
jgi:hypothetical protein